MLSTDTIFVLRDRFDRRNPADRARPEHRQEATGEVAEDRAALRIADRLDAAGARPKTTSALRSLPSAPSPGRWDRRDRSDLLEARSQVQRVRPLMTAVATDATRSTDGGELGAMRGILIGVALGASCWALVASLLYRLVV